jgi:hypothetical protein
MSIINSLQGTGGGSSLLRTPLGGKFPLTGKNTGNFAIFPLGCLSKRASNSLRKGHLWPFPLKFMLKKNREFFQVYQGIFSIEKGIQNTKQGSLINLPLGGQAGYP